MSAPGDPGRALAEALTSLGVEFEQPRPGACLVSLRGEHKLATVTWLIAGAHSLHVEAFFCRQPDENHAAFYRFLLERSGRMYGVHFALDPAGDVYLVGRLPLAAISTDEVDRLLGCVLSYADDNFDQALMIGFRHLDPQGVRVAGQARGEPGQPARLHPADRLRRGDRRRPPADGRRLVPAGGYGAAPVRT